MGTKAFKKEFYIVIVTLTFSTIASTIVEPIFPLKVLELGGSEMELGSIVSLASLVLIISRFPIGLFCSRAGFKQATTIALMGQFLSLLIYAFSGSTFLFFPARLIGALSSAILGIITLVTITSMVPKDEIAKAVTAYLTSFGISSMLGPILASFLLNHIDYSQIMMISAAFPVSAIVLINSTNDPMKSDFAKEQRAFDVRGLKWVRLLVNQLLEILRRRAIVIVGALHFLFAMTATFVTTFFSALAVEDLAMPATLVMLLISARGISNVFSRIPASYLVNRLSLRKILTITFVVLSISYFAIAISTSFIPLMVAMIVLGMGWGVRAVIEWTVAESCVPPKDRSMSSTLMSVLWDAAGATSGVIGGLLATHFSLSLIFIFSSLLMLLGAMIATEFPKEYELLRPSGSPCPPQT